MCISAFIVFRLNVSAGDPSLTNISAVKLNELKPTIGFEIFELQECLIFVLHSLFRTLD